MEQRLLAYDLPKETDTSKMMPDKNTYVKVRSLDETKNSLLLLLVFCKGDIFAPCLFIIYLDYDLRTSIDLIKKWLYTKKTRSRRYPAETVTNADYEDARALLSNTQTQDEFLLQSLEQAANGIGKHVHEDETEYMHFNEKK